MTLASARWNLKVTAGRLLSAVLLMATLASILDLEVDQEVLMSDFVFMTLDHTHLVHFYERGGAILGTSDDRFRISCHNCPTWEEPF